MPTGHSRVRTSRDDGEAITPVDVTGAFTDVDALSAVEVSFAGNAGTDPAVTADTGTLIDEFYISAAAQSRASDSQGLTGKALLAYSHLLGAGDNLTIIIDGGATTQAFIAVKWKEIR